MIKNNIFYDEELDKLPLFYRKMDLIKTVNIKELHQKDIFTQSFLHESKKYKQVIPTIPFSNFIINNEDE